MNLLMVGAGKGSFTMRGQQLGAALGARVVSGPTTLDFQWADVVVLIKRAALAYAREARAHGVPIVWDALDFWRQPHDNGKTEVEARLLLQQHLDDIQPTLMIGATEAMATEWDGVCLPHHSWTGLEPQPVREVVQTVAYEGNPAYLGSWRAALERACARRGWQFVVNPADLRDVDIFVALRDGQWDGWMCREWKSGVKVVNAIATGRPIISQASAALRELKAPGSTVSALSDLEAALDAWTPVAARAGAASVCRTLAPGLQLAAIADSYRATLARVREL